MNRLELKEIAERMTRGEPWEQEICNDGEEGSITVVFASGGQAVIAPGKALTVQAMAMEEDGRRVIRFFPQGWKHAGSG